MSIRSKFIDECVVLTRSGSGGAGAVSFRREKFVEFGGPDGGDGGKGGDVVLVAEPQMNTLLDYKFRPRHLAGNGMPGEGRDKSGKGGEDAVLPVPVGTVAYDVETGEILVDLEEAGQRFVVCTGGRGGKGNAHFKSSTRQAPRYSQPGEPNEEKRVRLELKLLADAGLVGFPNVGKSSLISRISAAKPKVADYPFTTLEPKLGVVQFGSHEHFVVADVPGLIVGASQGAGLGSRFLRHVERVKRIVHMVTVEQDYEDRDPIADFEAIEAELSAHTDELSQVPRILVLNRVDLGFVAEHTERMAQFAEDRGLPFFAISAATGNGVQALVKHLGQQIAQDRQSGISHR
ncbi:MAG: GTPase ObgE [Myxococcota bacterium]